MTQELWRELEGLTLKEQRPLQRLWQTLWRALGKLNIVRMLVAHSCAQLIMGEALGDIEPLVRTSGAPVVRSNNTRRATPPRACYVSPQPTIMAHRGGRERR